MLVYACCQSERSPADCYHSDGIGRIRANIVNIGKPTERPDSTSWTGVADVRPDERPAGLAQSPATKLGEAPGRFLGRPARRRRGWHKNPPYLRMYTGRGMIGNAGNSAAAAGWQMGGRLAGRRGRHGPWQGGWQDRTGLEPRPCRRCRAH